MGHSKFDKIQEYGIYHVVITIRHDKEWVL